MDRETLDLYIEWGQVSQDYIAAKERVACGELERDSEEFVGIKKRMSDLRTQWRQIRDALTEQIQAELPEGDAIATPATLEVVAEARPRGGRT